MFTPLITASQVAFWGLAPVMIALALGLILSRKPAHSALCLGGVMLGLAVQYAVLEAPFLFVTQIVVYTGSVMMLFVFTMMLIGVDSREMFVETIKGQRVASIILVLGFAVLIILAVGNAIVTKEVGLGAATEEFGGNVEGIAFLILGRYVVAFEVTAALLITGAMGAMLLAHAGHLKPRERQKVRLMRRMREYAERGADLGPLPSSGVYARHNAISYPSLLPDGSIAESSVSPTLVARGVAIVEVDELKAPTREAYVAIDEVRSDASGQQLNQLDVAPKFAPKAEIRAVESDKPRRGEAGE